MGNGRDLHTHIRTRIEFALDGRSWSWLARKCGVPQSTLASQKGKPRFTLGVLVSVANALERPITDFLPPNGPDRDLSYGEFVRKLEALVSEELGKHRSGE